jgi:hypothetical protein
MTYSFISYINKDFVLTVESFNYKLIFTKHSVVDKIYFHLFSNKKKDKISSLKNDKICENKYEILSYPNGFLLNY